MKITSILASPLMLTAVGLLGLILGIVGSSKLMHYSKVTSIERSGLVSQQQQPKPVKDLLSRVNALKEETHQLLESKKAAIPPKRTLQPEITFSVPLDEVNLESNYRLDPFATIFVSSDYTSNALFEEELALLALENNLNTKVEQVIEQDEPAKVTVPGDRT